jgi:hypothetical protein
MKQIIVLILTLSMMACNSTKPIYQPQEGDILLQDLECGPLCTAIKQVTFGMDSAEFSHIGLVQKVGEKWMVLEAISDGVKYTALLEFVKRSVDENDNPKIWVTRLKNEYKPILPKVKKYASFYLGKTYDDAFLMENDKYYCSELLYEIFKKANDNKAFFELEPMTFKHPETGQFLETWMVYYEKLGIAIPEGEPGINPAGISRSNKLELVQKLGKVSMKQ